MNKKEKTAAPFLGKEGTTWKYSFTRSTKIYCTSQYTQNSTKLQGKRYEIFSLFREHRESQRPFRESYQAINQRWQKVSEGARGEKMTLGGEEMKKEERNGIGK